MASRVGQHQRNLHVDRFTLGLTKPWSEPPPAVRSHFEMTKILSVPCRARSRQRSLSLFSLDLVKTTRHPKCCPACGHHFIPWNIWRVSIYSPIRCPKYDAKLIRRRDLQFFLGSFIIFCVFGVSLLLGFSPRAFFVCTVLVMVLVVWPVDAVTVRLVQAGRWRGWLRGYET
jgi:hypothetical protein